MKRSEWYGLYKANWNAAPLLPEAYEHPAKVSFGLAEKIYKHMLENGYIKPGDRIIDPFGGIAGFAFHALQNGLHWYGNELEEKYCRLGNQNIDLWNNRYAGWFANWGTAVLTQGDSRYLTQVIGGAEAVVSSSPYTGQVINSQSNGIDWEKAGRPDRTRPSDKRISPGVDAGLEYGITPGQLGSMREGDFDAVVSSPPFGEAKTGGGILVNGHSTELRKGEAKKYGHRVYSLDNQGQTPGQLGSMPPGDFDAVVSSSPYGDAVQAGDGPGARWDEATHPNNPDKVSNAAEYGRTPGQLGNMRMDAAVSSAPFEASLATKAEGDEYQSQRMLARGRNPNSSGSGLSGNGDYGSTPGNIGNDSGATFWQAARDIVQQVHEVLKPGGYGAFVCGDFVRKGKRVYFGKQWLDLCTAVGFEPVEWITCWKTEYRGTQLDVFGGENHKQVDRVSFFRRLSNEKNPDAAILNEDVIIVRKRT